MPLRDHFRPPITPRHSWSSFHALWAGAIATALNSLLPPRFFAAPLCTFAIEIDVANWDKGEPQAETPTIWTPPVPSLTVPLTTTTDQFEVRVLHQEGGLKLVGCVELVSPANKDRQQTREAFVSKCAAFLHEGIGLVLVDIVTSRHANLHNDLLGRLSVPANSMMQTDLYGCAYRPVVGEEQSDLQVWPNFLAIGQALPTLPLWLKDGPCLPVALEATYEQTLCNLRIHSNGNPQPS